MHRWLFSKVSSPPPVCLWKILGDQLVLVALECVRTDVKGQILTLVCLLYFIAQFIKCEEKNFFLRSLCKRFEHASDVLFSVTDYQTPVRVLVRILSRSKRRIPKRVAFYFCITFLDCTRRWNSVSKVEPLWPEMEFDFGLRTS